MYSLLILQVVYRISWLRAKARYTRWKEEHMLVRNEMTWTIKWFEHHCKLWEGRFTDIDDEESSDRLRCYALKQARLWKSLGECSRDLFNRSVATESF